MRITLNLQNYFEDHRSISKVLINDNVKSIRNFKQHISYIFKIDNFYLKCENSFLPSRESINLIEPNDIIWVCPKLVSNPAVYNFNSTNRTEIRNEITINNAEHTLVNDETFQGTRKKQKKAPKALTKSNLLRFDEQAKQTNNNKYTKNEEYKLNLSIVKDTESTEDTMDLTSDRNETNNMQPTYKTNGVSWRTGESPKLSKMKLPILLPLTKTTNIVETLVLSRNKTISSLPVSDNGFHTPNPSNSKVVQDKANQVENSIRSSNVSFETDSEATEAVTLVKKRKRTRSKKRKNKKERTLFEDMTTPVLSPEKPKITTIKAPTHSYNHIRFNSSDLEETEAEIDAKTKVKNDEVKTDDKTYDCNNDIEPSKNETCDKLKENVIVVNEIVEIVPKKQIDIISENFTEEILEKQPALSLDCNLKENDVIAFKTFRLSEDYTPEISSFVVGKVLKYDSISRAVSFDILFGMEQCIEPNGKFSLNEEEVEQEADVIKTEFLRTELLDCKLLVS